MGIDLGKIAENIKALVTYYIEIFAGILLSPSLTFQTLLLPQHKGRYSIIESSKFDERPIIFAAISLLIGLLIGSSFSIKDAPRDITSQVIASTVVPNLFIWLLYGIAVHVSARWLGGRGKLFQTVGGIFYVLGFLHPLLLFFMYLISLIVPNVLSYKMTVRDAYGYILVMEDFHKVNILGFSLQSFYYSVSTVLTLIYLYFPLSTVHSLGFLRIIILYIVGAFTLLLFVIIAVFGFATILITLHAVVLNIIN
jgi:hypothetical protein